jgi:hypothetical protein
MTKTKRKSENNLESLFKKIKINESNTNKRKEIEDLHTTFKKMKINSSKKRKEIEDNSFTVKKQKVESVVKKEFKIEDFCFKPIIHNPIYIY